MVVCTSAVLSREVYRVVGFEVEPKSIDSKRINVNADGSCTIQSGKDMQKLNPKGPFSDEAMLARRVADFRICGRKQSDDDLQDRMDTE